MFAVLWKYGIPVAVVSAISALYINSKSAVLVNRNISDPFTISIRVLQGDILAPFLFVILLVCLMRKDTSDLDSGGWNTPSPLKTISSQGIECRGFRQQHWPVGIHRGLGTGPADQYSISSKRSWKCFQEIIHDCKLAHSLHFNSMVTPSIMLLPLNILTPEWHQLQVLSHNLIYWRGTCFLETEKTVDRFPTNDSESEVILHHPCNNCDLMPANEVSYEQKCEVRLKFLTNLSTIKNKLWHKFYEFINWS